MKDGLNPAQYCEQYGVHGEHVSNMTMKGSSTAIGKSSSRNDIRSGDKISDRTERRDNVVPSKQAYATLAKSGYKAMPNNNGSSVIEGIYKPGGRR